MEIWKPIPTYENLYEVSDYGNIRNARNKKLLKLRPQKSGHMSIRLYKNKSKDHLVHTLVLAAFLGEKPLEYEVNHKDGIRHNNTLSNLEYMTHPENIQHSYTVLKRKSNARAFHGEDHGMSKLTESQVKEIRQKHTECKNPLKEKINKKLSLEYNVSVSTIEAVVYRRLWKHTI